MFALLAARNITLRPGRTLFLLLGYGMGVSVMIVLLSIGEALLSQARDEKLVGGGEVTVLPEGLDVEVMKTGGLGGLYFSIDHARFVHHQLLASPRLASSVAMAAPQVEGKLLYVRALDGREWAVKGAGEIPSASRAVGAGPALSEGSWSDDSLDRRWLSPTPAELRHQVDHFHLPPASARGDSTWAEWHYFNVLSSDARRWAFISFIVAGAVDSVAGPRWGGQLLVTLHEQGKPERRFTTMVPSADIRFSTNDANLTLGESTVQVLPDGRYAVKGSGVELGTGTRLHLDLTFAPTPGAYFPGASLGGTGVTSGYAVPALRADADGTICVASTCERFAKAQGYHDHNWGTWAGVTWEWGAARLGQWAMLYGRVQPPDSAAESQPLFLYLTDSLGFRSLFRPKRIAYVDGRRARAGSNEIAVPSHAEFADIRGDDTVRVDLTMDDAVANAGRVRSEQWFIQMKGRAHITGRIGGQPLDLNGDGFYETYRKGPAKP